LFVVTGATDGDETDAFLLMAIRNSGRPESRPDVSDDLKPWFAAKAGRKFHAIRIVPERLRGLKVDPVFRSIGARFIGIEVEAHV
jgi:hypothetical protein